MRPGPLTVITQRLRFAQERLQMLTRDAMNRRRTPDGFSRERHAEHAHMLRRAINDRRVIQQFLPRVAANDSRPSLPGAA